MGTIQAGVTSVMSSPNGKGAIINAFIASLDNSQSTRDTYRKAIAIFFDWIDFTGRRLDSLKRTAIKISWTASSASRSIDADLQNSPASLIKSALMEE